VNTLISGWVDGRAYSSAVMIWLPYSRARLVLGASGGHAFTWITS
jgi:hypothetical protein